MLDKLIKFFGNIKQKFKNKKEAEKYSTPNEDTDPAKAKQLATAKKEPYIVVLNTHVNPENVRNGFFELDWNEYFIVQLTNAGYQGANEEEIVNQWFQDLCRGIADEDGISMDQRPMGFINVKPLAGGKSEVS
jgi:hypothetical protein